MTDLEWQTARAIMDAMINQRIERLEAQLADAVLRLGSAIEGAHKHAHTVTMHDYTNAAREVSAKAA